MPAVSVLVPVRDARPWIASSFASLTRQTLRDLEIVAVDDGSSDGSGEWLERLARDDRRVRLVRTAARGLPAALNTALAHARAPLIARHDADDLSHRARLASQRDHLLAHPRVAVVGSRLRLFPLASAGEGMRRWAAWHNDLLDHAAMARELLIDSPLAHGTALIRRRWLERVGGWSERGWAEDLDLWVRLIERGARFAKLPQVLYGWRQHPGSSTRTDPRYARERFRALKLAALERGFLRRTRALVLVGTGLSFETWHAALEGAGRAVTPRRAGRPSPPALRALAPPMVLVYGARRARERWRAALAGTAWREGYDFVFVS